MTLPRLVLSLILAASVVAGCAGVGKIASDREAQANRDYPPIGQILTVDGVKVHAFVAGSGPDLVLLHGASGNLRDFTFSLVDKLKGRYRVIAFDRPGLGWTGDLGDRTISVTAQARLLRNAAAQLGVKRPIVLGHSYGGAITMAWGVADPDSTAALVIVSGATMPWEGGLGAANAVTASALGGATVVPLITAFVSDATARKEVAGIFAPATPPAGYADYIGIGLTLRRDSFRFNAQQVAALKQQILDLKPSYRTLKMPIELIHGDADTIVPLAVHARPLSELLESANLTVLPGVGHMPQHSNEADVIAAIDRAATRAGLR